MIHYPSIDPIALHVGPIVVYWYGLMYVIGILGAWALARFYIKHRTTAPINLVQLDNLIFAAALGVVIGGRIGYMLFYNFSGLIREPWTLFMVWRGGMSFHGGFLGVLISLFIFSRRYKIAWVSLVDFIAPLVPIGLGAGRIGNFINGELWGRMTEMPWGMVFPRADEFSRHPSQLYEFLLEGILLFICLTIFARKPRPPFAVSALFLLLYGSFRFFVEFFRQPDLDFGYIAWDWLTMGQLLSLPMIIIGIIGLRCAYKSCTPLTV